ncbi:hypothetical protein PQC43_gp112 [Escherichia phage vB_EcoP-101114UKE3]|uniref:Uncharacterized protein n=1 Tax=Escherichia phage vB_EcoP-101114UKE3 TaxID=2865794 RepID=A0AAE7XT53_9CAUD|nr:hypothetical protein PQC43_gp112 [Escherichia phage vB_EcoP-101114UKE3]QZI79272.1 hypothetical protein 101114UKE3_141 [Escherichia phage vB_EcoP-101114UKE3]USM81245.1 hypothetical protein 101114BS3_118 [Escherichia phage vB_EcoP-101114BS3]
MLHKYFLHCLLVLCIIAFIYDLFFFVARSA